MKTLTPTISRLKVIKGQWSQNHLRKLIDAMIAAHEVENKDVRHG